MILHKNTVDTRESLRKKKKEEKKGKGKIDDEK